MKKEVVVSDFTEKRENAFAELVHVACQFDSRITLESIMGIMAFNPSRGMTVNIETEGQDESEALSALEDFLVNC